MKLKCPHCFSEMVLTLKCNLELDQCLQSGVRLQGHMRKHLQILEKFESTAVESNGTGKLDTSNTNNKNSEKGYFYYKKEFRENGYIDDLFGFESE